MPVAGLWRRSSTAARRPSSSLPGGIWTSTTATSGRWPRERRRKSSASPVCANTSKPASTSRRLMPSRRRTSSSPITTRTASATGQHYPAPSGALIGGQQTAQRPVCQLGLVKKSERAASTHVVRPGGVGIDGGQDNARSPRQGRELLRERDSVSVRQIDVDEGGCGLHGLRGADGRRRGAGLADDLEPGIGQDALRKLAKRGVVIHNEYRPVHAQ